jgi:hypothetical protein
LKNDYNGFQFLLKSGSEHGWKNPSGNETSKRERCDMGDLHWVISLILGTIVASMLMLANKIKEH